MTTLRPETVEDAKAVAELHVRAWRSAYAGILPDDLLAGLDPGIWAQRRAQALTGDGHAHASLVAERGGTIAGFVSFGPYRVAQNAAELDPEFGEISAIYVDPRHWRGGIGGVLMRAALENLEQPEVRLWVLAENKQAQGFYLRHGLSPDGVTALYRPRGTELDYAEIRFAVVRR